MRLFAGSMVIRQALVSTLVMLVAIASVAAAGRIAIERQQRRALLATIDTDIAGLADGMRRGGIEEVRRRIADRLALAGGPGAHYRLSDARGMVLEGDLVAPVPLDAARSQSGGVGALLARATLLRGGYALVVARSLAPVAADAARLTRLAVDAALPAAALSLVVSGLFARHVARRAAAVTRALRRFEAGDHAARAGIGGGDELAMLARHADAHLARAAALIDAQRDISDNIAHELRTPLSHLDARLLRALARSADPEVTTELHFARDDIRAIVVLFDTLLDLALAETGEHPAAAPFDLSERAAALAELYAGSAEEMGREFVARIAGGVVMRGESMAMTRAIANLLDNAFKFTPPGARVRLTVAPGPRIVVEDNGPGVAPDDRERIFQRFRGASGAGGGHGLGLALVRVIAARHGLHALCEDAQPGARFVLAPAATAA